MAIDSRLHQEILQRLGIGKSELERRASRLRRAHGPMSGDEARWIIAHNADIDLSPYLNADQMDRVRALRVDIDRSLTNKGTSPGSSARNRSANGGDSVGASSQEAGPSRIQLFDGRCFHDEVKKSSRKLFGDRHNADSVRKAFQRLNNRVKKLVDSSADGQGLMATVFAKEKPMLEATPRSTESQQNEHDGMRFLFMGSMAALRNPLAHEDEWVWQKDSDRTLECLGLASLLHAFVDRCENYVSPTSS